MFKAILWMYVMCPTAPLCMVPMNDTFGPYTNETHCEARLAYLRDYFKEHRAQIKARRSEQFNENGSAPINWREDIVLGADGQCKRSIQGTSV